MKKIVVLLDGTWNKSNPQGNDDVTNVFKIEGLLENKGNVIYEQGVGGNWYDHFGGGVFGVGLSGQIQKAYKELSKLYEDGDEVFIFGFSRGAYAARSLVGLIRNSGLVRSNGNDEELDKLVSEAYLLYRARDDGPDSENAIFFRKRSRIISIKFLGIWDTVGALGIPLESFDWFNRSFYEFHDTELSKIVENAYHALAVDEHRKNYQCTLWDPKEKTGQNIEQVWFPGAHANVGGGYRGNCLSDIPLVWMVHKARGHGLSIRDPEKRELDLSIIDSYSDFLGGEYKKILPRFYRKIGGSVFGNEIIHSSVFEKMKTERGYSPKNPVGSNIKTPSGVILSDKLSSCK